MEGRARAFVELGKERMKSGIQTSDRCSFLGILKWMGWSLFARNVSALFSSSPPAFLYLLLAEKKNAQESKAAGTEPFSELLLGSSPTQTHKNTDLLFIQLSNSAKAG